MNFFSLFKRKLIYKFKKKYSIDDDNCENKSLDNLFELYGSDKANFFSITKSKGHGYSQYYHNHLKELQNKRINILEVGSYAGSSAAAFTKYFPNAEVFCLDVNISNFKYTSKRINVFGLDIKDDKKLTKIFQEIFLEKKFKNFDLIIDDGSHNLNDILIGLKFLFDYLKDKGVYVIEDFKFPNYYAYNRNVDDILIDRLLKNLKEKKFFNSSILNKNDQLNLINSIKKIDIYKGNLKESDICFIKKN